MQELINIKNDEAVTEEQVIQVIGIAFQQKEFEIAVELMEWLNSERIKRGYKPYSLEDFMFMNWNAFFSKPNTKEKKCVYIAEFKSGLVKIGVSNNPKKRIKTLESQNGFEVNRVAISKPVINSFEIECKLHKIFDSKREKGEYFRVNFDDVIMAVKDKFELDVAVSKSIYKKYEGQVV